MRMLSFTKNKLQMCWVTQHQFRSRQMWKIFTYSPRKTHYFSVIQNDLSWLNNLFMASFQLISMSSYAKNKLQMCWVIQHQCRSLQMWKIFTNSQSTLTFYLLQKMTRLVWTIHSWQAFHSLVCTLTLRTNNRCVESLNISVMSPNVEAIHKFNQYTDNLSTTKKVVKTEQSIHGNVSTH